jgi:hypothetical protein
MYLARIRQGREVRYFLRQSFFDQQQGCYFFRQIYDLGTRPGDFINHAVVGLPVFHEDLEEAVALAGAGGKAHGLLEELLREFLTRDEKEQYNRMHWRRPFRSQPFTQEDEERLQREIHLFDRRRLYFLRFGAVDQSRIHRLHKKLCRPLFGQCRDEREFYFAEQEKVLRPAEYRIYVFAIFDLQRFFGESYASYLPEALDQALMSDRLVEEICRLNRDDHFWAGMAQENWLHPHLRRYLVMFFDYDYGHRPFVQDFAREFMDRHRTFSWPEREGPSEADKSAVFGRTMAELRLLPKRELTRLFRKRAKELHPDSGGNHERFILLSATYEELKRRFGR